MAHTPMIRRLVRALQQARRLNLIAAGAPAPISRAEHARTRRKLLKATMLAGAAGLSSACLPAALWPRPARGAERSARVAVVGAGLAGLNAAYQLRKAGVRADVYEAGDRLGGRVWSRTGPVGEGLTVELGGEFINTDHADMLALAGEFGLTLYDRREDARSPVPPVGYFLGGASWREAELAAALRPLVAQITLDADLIDQDWDRYAPRFDRLTVRAYLDRHAALIPLPVVRTLFENAMRTEYGVETSESSALQLLFLLPTVDGDRVDVIGYSDEVYTVAGGNGRLIEALGQRLAGQIHTGHCLEQLESGEREGVRLGFRHGRSIEADYVILAIPFTTLRSVTLQVALPPRLRACIKQLDLGANEKLLAGYRTRAWRQPNGFVEEAWTDLGYSEAWDGTQRQPDRADAALTYFMGGREVSALEDASDPTSLGREFTARLAAFVPGLDAAATDRYARTAWTRNPLARGGYTSFRPGQVTGFQEFRWVESDDPGERQEVQVGRLVFAGEHVSDEYYGFMNGGAQTGRLAAAVVLRELTALAHAAGPSASLAGGGSGRS
jgi:monoamine oxidase